MHDLRVQRMLGEGNMSNVVHCVCSRSGAHVAVKMYHRDKMNAMNVKQVGGAGARVWAGDAAAGCSEAGRRV